MAKLSTAERNALPRKSFAGPGRSFPVNDKAHAKLAIPMAKRSYSAGNISKSTETAVVKKARASLHQRLGVLPRKR